MPGPLRGLSWQSGGYRQSILEHARIRQGSPCLHRGSLLHSEWGWGLDEEKAQRDHMTTVEVIQPNL